VTSGKVTRLLLNVLISYRAKNIPSFVALGFVHDLDSCFLLAFSDFINSIFSLNCFVE